MFSVVAIVLLFGFGIARGQWQEPTVPPPGSNVSAPISVDDLVEAKQGGLLIDPTYVLGSAFSLRGGSKLDVRGEVKVTGTSAEVGGGLQIDNSSDDSLVVSGTQVGIGTDAFGVGYKLTVNGGGIGIGSEATPVSSDGVYAYSNNNWGIIAASTDASGRGAAYGEYAAGYGVHGKSTAGAGVMGQSAVGYGVYAHTANGGTTLLGVNTLTAGNFWAGYFVGKLGASDEVVGAKFLPTKLQNSLVPYTVGWRQTFTTAVDGPANLAFDGTYIWAANVNSTTVSKIRASDGVKVTDVTIGNGVLDVVFDGSFVWVSRSGASNQLAKVNPWTNAIVATYGIDANAANLLVTSEGANTFIWYASTSTNAVRKLNANGVLQCSASGLSTPRGLAYDGINVWVANNGANNVLRINSTCGSVGSSVAVTAPFRLAFDGSYMWATTRNASSTNNVTKIYGADGVIAGTYSTGVAQANDLAFDGTFFWVTHDTAVVRIGAGDGTVYPALTNPGGNASGVVFDGTYAWVGKGSGNAVDRYYSGSGWGHTDPSSMVQLQSSTPGTAQIGGFAITGSATLGGSLQVNTGDLSVTGNTWGGTADQSTSVSGNSGTNSYNCSTNGYFVKGIEVNAFGQIVNFFCRPL